MKKINEIAIDENIDSIIGRLDDTRVSHDFNEAVLVINRLFDKKRKVRRSNVGKRMGSL